MCEEKQCKQRSSLYCNLVITEEHQQSNSMAYLGGWTDKIALINPAFMRQWSQETAVTTEFASATLTSERSSWEPLNLTLVCVFGDEHRNRIKLIAADTLPI